MTNHLRTNAHWIQSNWVWNRIDWIEGILKWFVIERKRRKSFQFKESFLKRISLQLAIEFHILISWVWFRPVAKKALLWHFYSNKKFSSKSNLVNFFRHVHSSLVEKTGNYVFSNLIPINQVIVRTKPLNYVVQPIIPLWYGIHHPFLLSIENSYQSRTDSIRSFAYHLPQFK